MHALCIYMFIFYIYIHAHTYVYMCQHIQPYLCLYTIYTHLHEHLCLCIGMYVAGAKKVEQKQFQGHTAKNRKTPLPIHPASLSFSRLFRV